jgi:hypothetical protein
MRDPMRGQREFPVMETPVDGTTLEVSGPVSSSRSSGSSSQLGLEEIFGVIHGLQNKNRRDDSVPEVIPVADFEGSGYRYGRRGYKHMGRRSGKPAVVRSFPEQVGYVLQGKSRKIFMVINKLKLRADPQSAVNKILDSSAMKIKTISQEVEKYLKNVSPAPTATSVASSSPAPVPQASVPSTFLQALGNGRGQGRPQQKFSSFEAQVVHILESRLANLQQTIQMLKKRAGVAAGPVTNILELIQPQVKSIADDVQAFKATLPVTTAAPQPAVASSQAPVPMSTGSSFMSESNDSRVGSTSSKLLQYAGIGAAVGAACIGLVVLVVLRARRRKPTLEVNETFLNA